MRIRRSLAWRLSVAGAIVCALSSALLGAHLYGSFEDQLLRRDDVQLLGKLRQLRQLLGHSETPSMLRDQTDYLRDTMSGESNALIEIHAVTGRDGEPLLAINPPKIELPRLPPLALDREPEPRDLQHWSSVDGVPAAGVSALARLGPDVVEIRLARLYPERSALLAAYRVRIAAASLGAGALAALLLMAVIWRGLAPLRQLRAQTTVIGPQSLGLRLQEAGAPPELRPLVEGVNAMLARLEQGYAQLNQFAADLAHELRTPLATLTGQTEVMLSRTRTEAEYVRLLEVQLQELARLNRMVDSLLFLARSEHQALSGGLRRQALSGAQELARQADYFADLAEERGLRVHHEGDAPVWAEPQLLRRALANLMTNALRHARPGTVIELRARVDDDRGGDSEGVAVLEVINVGEPLPADVLPRLFDRFFRADSARSGDANGNGLGLALVQAVMTLHGGTAQVWQDGGGRIGFALRLPVPAALRSP